MVKPFLLTVFGLIATLSFAEDTGPVLYGDGGGRLWKWSGGEKTWLTDVGLNLVLGGIEDKSLWGWSVEGARARFFTLALPDAAKPGAESQPQPPELPQFETVSYPVPELAARAGDRILLVWGARSGNPRYELWQGAERIAAQAWDDGRSVYALAVAPDGWLLVGRSATGQPWLELSGNPVPVVEGWRGRLTVAAWVPEKHDKKDEKPASPATNSPGAAPLPAAKPPVHPWAAGWGAPGQESPRPLIWGPEGWVEPAEGSLAVYPVLGAAGEGTLVLGGWQADAGTGALRPWFWDGEQGEAPGGAADGQPVALSFGGKGGAFLVVRHQSSPWFTAEDGKESKPLDGLDADDRVVAVDAAKASP